MTQPITYDAEGRCTRCGSTGYWVNPVSSWQADLIACPCRGWRPVEFAPKDRTWVDVCGPKVSPTPASNGAVGWYLMVGTGVDATILTHFRPRPEPPEVGT